MTDLNHEGMGGVPALFKCFTREAGLDYDVSLETAPGDVGKIIDYSARLAELFHAANPEVDVRLVATWSRADQTYPPSGHWFGKSIETMAINVRAAYDQAAGRSPYTQGWPASVQIQP